MPAWRETHPGVEEMKVAVMGCVVNGPGESQARRHRDQPPGHLRGAGGARLRGRKAGPDAPRGRRSSPSSSTSWRGTWTGATGRAASGPRRRGGPGPRRWRSTGPGVYSRPIARGRLRTWVTNPRFFVSEAFRSVVRQQRRRMMSRDFVGALLQLNAEKQVPQEALIRAVEEGIQAAYRRVAGEEDIFVRIEPATGEIRVYRGRYVVDQVEDPIGPGDGGRGPDDASRRACRRRARDRAAGRGALRPDRRPDREADHPPADARGRARPGLRPVRQPRGRADHRIRGPGGAARDHPGRRQGRRGHPRDHRAEPARALPDRPARQGVRARGPPVRPRAADHGLADPQGLPPAAVRAGGARRSTPGPSRSRRSPARRGAGPRWRSRPARTGWTRSGRPSASAARGSRRSSRSSQARRST